ncbi:MAG TPA: hypothetical protein VIR33_02480 [Thermopolyspora sp.]
MTTYRLPDWLGGCEVLDVAIPDDGNTLYAEVVVQVPDRDTPAAMRMTLPRAALVEVRPPSIDDPVNLPLALVGAQPSSGAELALLVERADTEPYAAFLNIAGVGSIWLTAGKSRDAARALWLLGTGGDARPEGAVAVQRPGSGAS